MVSGPVRSHPWQAPQTPEIQAKEWGLSGLRAADCGVCHTEIYAEWKQSTHAAAWSDPQFQAEFHKDPEVGWLCLNCHTPVANQQAEIVRTPDVVRNPSTDPNPAFDPTFRSEGVSCLACHYRPQGIAAPHADVKAPHAIVYAPDLTEDATCLGCHQATARLEDALVCHFNTGMEKEEAGVTASCTSCHMPEVKRSMAVGGPVRSGGRHTWAGSGIGKGSTTPHPGLDGLDFGFEVEPIDGDAHDVRVSLHNARAGHRIPTGDPERAIEVQLAIHDAAGAVLATHTERIGQTWQWSPVAMRLDDNRIGVNETRWVVWRYPGNPAAQQVEVKVRHIRLSQENLDYHIALIRKGHAGPTVAELEAYPTSRLLYSATRPLKSTSH